MGDHIMKKLAALLVFLPLTAMADQTALNECRGEKSEYFSEQARNLYCKCFVERTITHADADVFKTIRQYEAKNWAMDVSIHKARAGAHQQCAGLLYADKINIHRYK